MSPSSIYEQVTREHPAYRAGFAHDQDVGLRAGLELILAEAHLEDDAATLTRLDDPHGHDARVHAYTAGRLSAVGQRVASAFRQPR